MKRVLGNSKVKYEESMELQELEKNPDLPENQMKIQRHIQSKNVESNYSTAMEELPEAFAKVCLSLSTRVKCFVPNVIDLSLFSLLPSSPLLRS